MSGTTPLSRIPASDGKGNNQESQCGAGAEALVWVGSKRKRCRVCFHSACSISQVRLSTAAPWSQEVAAGVGAGCCFLGLSSQPLQVKKKKDFFC